MNAVQQSYTEGFVIACTARGLDPEQLVKQSAVPVVPRVSAAVKRTIGRTNPVNSISRVGGRLAEQSANAPEFSQEATELLMGMKKAPA